MKRLFKIGIILLACANCSVHFGQCHYTVGSDISVSASGFESGTGFSQTYAMVDHSSDSIVDIQSGGIFSSVSLGAYRIYAVNYEGALPAVLAVDSLWNSVALHDSNSFNCFATIGPKDSVINVCQQLCYDSSITVSSSGFESGTGFSQTYILVNKNDSIYASNSTGTFTQADYLDSGTVEIYAVNTNDNDVLNEINDGGLWADVEAMELSTCTEYIGARTYLISACPTPLNLKQIILNGTMLEYENQLEWTDEQSELYDHYEVFRMSDVNNDLIKIGEQLVTDGVSSYSFSD